MRLKDFLLGGLIGAAAVYLFDSDQGSGRRALLRQKAARLARQSEETLEKVAQDKIKRAKGRLAEARSLLKIETVDNQTLQQRVRSSIGRAVQHPGSIQVDVNEGRVILRGPVLQKEVDALLAKVSSVRGITEIDNRLEIHIHPGKVPGLQ